MNMMERIDAAIGERDAEIERLRNALTREKQRQTYYRRRCAVLDEKIEELQQQLYELKLEHDKD